MLERASNKKGIENFIKKGSNFNCFPFSYCSNIIFIAVKSS